MSPQTIVIDTCCLLNLLATKQEVLIIKSLGLTLAMSATARQEVLYLSGPPDSNGRPTRELADLSQLENNNLLAVYPLTNEINSLFVQCAIHLKDIDASCLSLAMHLQVPLASDDRKVAKISALLSPVTKLKTTLQMLRDASLLLGLTPPQLSKISKDLHTRGNFDPPRQDPNRAWFLALLGLP